MFSFYFQLLVCMQVWLANLAVFSLFKLFIYDLDLFHLYVLFINMCIFCITGYYVCSM